MEISRVWKYGEAAREELNLKGGGRQEEIERGEIEIGKAER